MAKELDYSRIANKLVLIYSGHKTDNTLSVWTKEFDGILNAKEVKRLYELFSGALCLLASAGGRKLTWTEHANKDNFNAKWCKSIFEKHGIQTVFGPTLGPDGKALHPRTNYPHKVAPVKEEVKPILPEYAQPRVRPDQLTDEELHTYIDKLQATLNAFVAERDRRDFLNAKKAELLKIFSEMAKEEGFDLEDIIGII